MSLSFLEEVLECVENLPAELREQLEQISKMDNEVEVYNKEIESKVANFFLNASIEFGHVKDTEYDNIINTIHKTFELNDEKINIAVKTYKMIGKYISVLQKEIGHFEKLIQTDSLGIIQKIRTLTESAESIQQKWDSIGHSQINQTHSSMSNMETLASDKTSEDIIMNSSSVSSTTHSASLHDKFIKDNPLAIPATSHIPVKALKQAATKKMKDSKAPSNSSTPNPKSIKRKIPPPGVYQNVDCKRMVALDKDIKVADLAGEKSQVVTDDEKPHLNIPVSAPPDLASVATNPPATSEAEDTLYCICRQVSFGEMIACDNQKCEIQWFHYCCVGLAEEPKGEWFCPKCQPARNSS